MAGLNLVNYFHINDVTSVDYQICIILTYTEELLSSHNSQEALQNGHVEPTSDIFHWQNCQLVVKKYAEYWQDILEHSDVWRVQIADLILQALHFSIMIQHSESYWLTCKSWVPSGHHYKRCHPWPWCEPFSAFDLEIHGQNSHGTKLQHLGRH